MGNFMIMFSVFSLLGFEPYMNLTQYSDLFIHEKAKLTELAHISCVTSNAIDRKDKVAVRSCQKCIMDLVTLKSLRDSSTENSEMAKYEELDKSLTEAEIVTKFCAKSKQLKKCHHDDSIESGIESGCYVSLFLQGSNASRKRAQCDEDDAIRDCTSSATGGFQKIDLSQPVKCATYEKWSRCVTAALKDCPGPTPVKFLLHHLRRTITDCIQNKRNGDTVEIIK